MYASSYMLFMNAGVNVFQLPPWTVYCMWNLKETCEAIWDALQTNYVKAPSCAEEWKGIYNSKLIISQSI